MGKSGDAGVPRAVIALAGGLGAHDELDGVAGRILEADELAHMTRGAFFPRAVMYGMAEPLQRRAGGLQVFGAAEFEAGRLVVRVAVEIAERVGAVIGLEVGRALAPLGDFEAQNVDRVPLGAGEVGGAEAAVDHIVEFDHAGCPPRNSGCSVGEPQAQCDAAVAGNWRGPRATMCGPNSVSAA